MKYIGFYKSFSKGVHCQKKFTVKQHETENDNKII